MGLFVQRPEEPAEWAGIPSEPAHPESAAERLTDAAPLDPAGLGVGGIALAGPGSVESVVFPVEPVIERAEGQESAEDE